MKEYTLKVIADNEMCWIVESEEELAQIDIDFIENYYPVTYWSDCDCRHWAFDTKLPSGKWLECISLKEYKYFTAKVF